MRLTRWLAGAGVALSLAVPTSALGAPNPVEVQILGINDFHGQIQPPEGFAGQIGGIPVGGAEFLATHLQQARRSNPNTMTVSAGDLIGASPLLSALFHDEPTIEAMNEMDLDLNAVGNHEFDEGVTELLRMQDGGCHPTDGCQDGTGFGGAEFGFLAANVVWRDTGDPILPPYAIRKFDGIKVGFIGMTLEGTPDIVSQEGIKDVRFLDEAETADKYARVLRREHGVRAIVVLLHEGGVPTRGTVDDCVGVSDPIESIVRRTTQAVDVFVTGHTHQAYLCQMDGRVVTSASAQSRVYTDIDLLLDRRSKDVIRSRTRKDNVLVTRDVDRDAAISDLIAWYSPFVERLASRVVGRISASITRAQDDSAENAMGNLIADAQLAATRDAGAVAAFMNPGGVRADLTFRDGTVTYGDVFSVQPFGNSLITMTLTGAQLYTMLAQQWCEQRSQRVLLPSAGVTYTWDWPTAQANLGDDYPGEDDCAVEPNPVTSLAIGGVAVDPAATYRITVNSFLAGGGDLFRVLPAGTQPTGGELDLDALEAYLAPSISGSPIGPPALDRITVVGRP